MMLVCVLLCVIDLITAFSSVFMMCVKRVWECVLVYLSCYSLTTVNYINLEFQQIESFFLPVVFSQCFSSFSHASSGFTAGCPRCPAFDRDSSHRGVSFSHSCFVLFLSSSL